MTITYESIVKRLTKNAPAHFILGMAMPTGVAVDELQRLGAITQQLGLATQQSARPLNENDKDSDVRISLEDWKIIQELALGFTPLLLGRIIGLNNQLRKQESLYIQAQIDSATEGK